MNKQWRAACVIYRKEKIIIENRTYAYARVSSLDQNLWRQLDAFKKIGIPDERIITDKKSGKDFERPGYTYLKQGLLRSGDTLIIKSLDRLSRSKSGIKNELEFFKENGIRLKVIDLPTTMIDLEGQSWVIDMVNNILIEVLSSIAEQERLTIKQRQAEGIAAAKKRGAQLGRPRREVDSEEFEEIYSRWKNGEIYSTEAVKQLKISKSTFYRRVYEKRNGGITEENKKGEDAE